MEVESDQVSWPLGAALIHGNELRDEQQRFDGYGVGHSLGTAIMFHWWYVAAMSLGLFIAYCVMHSFNHNQQWTKHWFRLGGKKSVEENQGLIKTHLSSEPTTSMRAFFLRLWPGNGGWTGSPRPSNYKDEGISVRVDVGITSCGTGGTAKRRSQPYASSQVD